MRHELDVSLVDGGCESIEVKDNGTGIREEDFELLAIRNTTSKISKFEDLTTRLSTFGFRVHNCLSRVRHYIQSLH